MICGSPGMLRDLKALLEAAASRKATPRTPGDFVIERAFASSDARRAGMTATRPRPRRAGAPRAPRRRAGELACGAGHARSILRAATKVFAKHGFDGGRVEQISQAAHSRTTA